MIFESKCTMRRCKYYIGIKSDDEPGSPEVELNERHYCEAFPDGIPAEIAFGENLHLTPLKNQKNQIVYEKAAS